MPIVDEMIVDNSDGACSGVLQLFYELGPNNFLSELSCNPALQGKASDALAVNP